MQAREAARQRIAVVGTGAMGSRIARRLLDGGFAVTVWNRSPAAAEALVAYGADLAATPADAAATTDLLLVLVSDADALSAVTTGASGIATAADHDLIVAPMCTVGTTAIGRFGELFPPHTKLLDAPIVGSRGEAESGTLTILVGGASEVIAQARGTFDTLGTVLRVGEFGAGQAAKLVVQAALLASVASLGEVVALGQALGLSREKTFDVLAVSRLAAEAQRRRATMDSKEYAPRFTTALARKDADLFCREPALPAARLRLLPAVREWLADATQFGCGDLDYTSMLELIAPAQPRLPHVQPRPSDISYDGLIVDLDGVVWVGDDPVPGAADALRSLVGAGVRVVYLTNDPQSSRAQYVARLQTMGAPVTADGIVTSASALAAHLAADTRIRNGTVLAVGSVALHEEVTAAGLTEANAGDTSVEAVVVAAHRDLHYRELSAATAAVLGGATLFAPGRDTLFPVGRGFAPATGAIVAAVEAATGVVATIVGKPEPTIFDIARRRLEGCRRIAVIGDNVHSDIVGAKRAGLDGVLVLTGVSSAADAMAALASPDITVPTLVEFGALLTGH